MTELEKILDDELKVDFYLEDTSTKQFISDVRTIIQDYSDNGVIDRAIELLQSCRTTKG